MLRLREKYLDKQRAIVKLKLEEMECQRKLKELKMAEQEIKPMIADSFSDLDEEYKLVTKIASSKNNFETDYISYDSPSKKFSPIFQHE